MTGLGWLRQNLTLASSIVAVVTSTIAFLAFAENAISGWFEKEFEKNNARQAEWIDQLAGQVSQMSETMDDQRAIVRETQEVVDRLSRTIQAVVDARAEENKPAWKFDTNGTSITDGTVGGRVAVRVAGYKLKDCGAPLVDLYFQTEDNSIFRFEDNTVIDSRGRGVALPPNPSRLVRFSYFARIPEDPDIKLGRALGFITVTYPSQCPLVPAETAGPLPFRVVSK